MDEATDARGTKRTCQSAQCGSRFYDLNRDPIVCPICTTPYVIASAPLIKRDAVAEKPVVKEEKEKTEKVASEDDDVELVSLEDAEVDVDDDDDDEVADTFLEDDEDEDDPVTAIVGGADEEET